VSERPNRSIDTDVLSAGFAGLPSAGQQRYAAWPTECAAFPQGPDADQAQLEEAKQHLLAVLQVNIGSASA
jgi:hypothetical protein